MLVSGTEQSSTLAGAASQRLATATGLNEVLSDSRELFVSGNDPNYVVAVSHSRLNEMMLQIKFFQQWLNLPI